MRVNFIQPLLIVAIIISVMGCSGSQNNPVTNAPLTDRVSFDASASHQTWGLWQFIADPDNETLDIVQLRGVQMHLNALPFLEPPPYTYLTVENVQFNGNIIEVDIGLRHPFLGLTQFTGFDVAGILITNGSVTGFDDPDIVMAGEGDTRLLNPDGYTRWWNPAEFPSNGTIFGYQDGMFGTPDSYANFNSILNAYKYFCDDLEADGKLSAIDPAKRGMFSVGQKNIRHYKIELGDDGLIFNYAVDACWAFPSGDYPWTAPDDFAPEANRPEAYRISVTEIDNTLYYDPGYPPSGGGSVILLIDVYDWYDSHLNEVKVECLEAFEAVVSSTPIESGNGWSRYQFDIDAEPVSSEPLNLLITVSCQKNGYQGLLPGKQVAAYFTHSVKVCEILPPPVGKVFVVSLAENKLAVINAATYEKDGFVYINGEMDNMLCAHSPYVYGNTLYNGISYIFRVHGNSLEVEYIEVPVYAYAAFDIDICTDGSKAALAMPHSIIYFDLLTETEILSIPVDSGYDPHGVELSLDDQFICASIRGPGYPNSSDNYYLLIDANDGGIACTASLPSGYLKWPMNLAVNPSTGNVYVTDGGDEGHTIHPFNAGSCVAQPSIDTEGIWPTDVAISPDGTRLYCTNYYNSNISVVDLTDHTYMKMVGTLYKPWGIAVANDGHDIFVGIEGGYQSGNEVQVIHTDDFIDYETEPIITIGELGNGIWDVVYVK